MQTSVQWLIEQLEERGHIIPDHIEVTSLEMEKQQIIDAAERWKGTDFAEKYYAETYGSKGSDAKDYTEAQKNEERVNNAEIISDVTSSQTISDEDIMKGAKEWYNKEGAYSASAIALKTWVYAIRWYREELKK